MATDRSETVGTPRDPALPAVAGAARATLVASLTELPASEAGWSALPTEAEVLEVRADLVGEVSVEALRQAAPGRQLLFTLRSEAEGGGNASSPARRAERLAAAVADGFDWIDLEAARDLEPAVLEVVPAARRVISWHGQAPNLEALADRFARMARVPAALYKLIPEAERSGDELVPLTLLHALGRRDVVAFASGPIGMWTRLLSPRLGAPWVYGATGFGPPAAPGQPTIAALCRDYGLPALPPVERLFGVAGNPATHSLSPRLHNGGYRALGIAALYLPFEASSFGEFWLNVVESTALPAFGWPLVGLSVTAPFKDAALAVAAGSSPRAKLIGAANTLTFDDPGDGSHGWSAEATDPEGVIGPLAARGLDVAGARALVVGAGGAGRSAAVALRQAGARVTLANRSEERGRRAAGELHVEFEPLAGLDPGPFQIVVHATPLGRPPLGGFPEGEPRVAEFPFEVEALAPGTIVIDLVYGGEATPLVLRARELGLTAIDGREVLLYQALPQFEAMVGTPLALELGRRLLDLAVEPDHP